MSEITAFVTEVCWLKCSFIAKRLMKGYFLGKVCQLEVPLCCTNWSSGLFLLDNHYHYHCYSYCYLYT